MPYCLGTEQEQEEERRGTYSLGFFLGPGLPLILGSAAPAPGAVLFMPFFLDPSTGGPIGSCDGVPLAAGVPGFDSEALSPLDADAAATVSVGSVFEVAGDSLAGDSSFTEVGSTIFRRLTGDTLSVVRTEDLLADFLRSLSFAGVAVLVAVEVEEGMLVDRRGGDDEV